MGQLKITDLVDKKALDELRDLNNELQVAKDKYAEAAKELAKGINIKVEGLEDLQKMSDIINKNTAKAKEAEKEVQGIEEKRKKITEETTNAISRKLAAQEKENAKARESVKQNKEALETARKVLGTREQNLKRLAQLEKAISENAKEEKKLAEAEKNGSIEAEKAVKARAKLIGTERQLKAEKQDIQKTLAIEERMSNAAAGGYTEMSQKLELLKRAYKQMDDETKKNPFGQRLADEITNLDNALKDSAASMGEFQRNTGNYAIASTNKLSELLGISDRTGASLLDMAQSGSLGFSKLKVSATAFFKSLTACLANPAVLAVLGIGGSVVFFKWLYDYNKGLEKATNMTKQFTGASGTLLKQQRNEVQALADMYGKDFKEVLMSVNVLAKQFGISFDEAFGYVEKGFVSGADANEQFLDVLKEYPTYFSEAGISASEFVAITTEASKMGVFSDKALDSIKEGNIRLREMTDATRKALEGIGISSEKVEQSLLDGSKTTFDIIKEVSAKLEEFPESSAAVGTALADIFGGAGEDAGLNYIKMLKTIETDQDKVKEKAGGMADLWQEQLDAQKEMQNALDALFDFTGGSFEELTGKATIFVKEGIAKIIHGIISLANYFIDLYNNSVAFRKLLGNLVLNFKSGIDFVGNLFNSLISIVKAFGTALNGAFTLDLGKIQKGLSEFAQSYKTLVTTQIADMEKNYDDYLKGLDKKINPIVIPIRAEGETEADINSKGKGIKEATEENSKVIKELNKEEANERNKLLNTIKALNEKLRERDRIIQEMKEMNGQMKEREKVIEALQETEVELMDDGYQKGLELMKANHEKKLAEIKGNSEEENALRENLNKIYLQKVERYDKVYNDARAKADLENRLACVEEGSEEELSLRLSLLELEKEKELSEADKTGADKVLIEQKYNGLLLEAQKDFAKKRLEIIQNDYSVGFIADTIRMEKELTELKKHYAKGLIAQDEFERRKIEITEKYSLHTAESTIAMLEKQLETENLSLEDRERLEQELLKAKVSMEAQIADNMIAQTERQNEADRKMMEERKKRAFMYAEAAAQAFSSVSELMSTLYDGDLERLDNESEANQEAHDKEIERIEELQEIGAISAEEAEARKISAKQKAERKEEEIERKKQQIMQKQAIWNKANQVAQTIIATARAVMEAFAMGGPVLAAMAGAMGAAQVATIIATPIPKYAKGTDYHEGGLAVVGDGGKQEIVLTDAGYWITPDIPTVVDLPKGAEVLPDAKVLKELSKLNFNPTVYGANVNVKNDYSELTASLSRGQKDIRDMFKASMKQRQKLGQQIAYDNFKKTIL